LFPTLTCAVVGDAFTSVTLRPGPEGVSGNPGETGATGRVTVSAIRAIHPFRHEGLWVFDDETVELRQEPFVSGADGILDWLAAGIPGAATGFTLLSNAQPFPGAHLECVRQREESGGKTSGPSRRGRSPTTRK
jgi:hypothetical protein